MHFQSVVGDNPPGWKAWCDLPCSASDLLVFSGGLGPTDDDLTKQTVARASEDELRLDSGEELARIRAFFTAWGRTMPPNNEKGICAVRGRKLQNANGTAPGMLFEAKAGGQWAVLLPGPPAELQPMFLNEVRPWLAGLTSCALHSLYPARGGHRRKPSEGKVAHLLSGENPTAALYAKTGEVFIRITSKARMPPLPRLACRALAGEFYAVLGDAVYGEDGETLAAAVVHALQKTGATAATAEKLHGRAGQRGTHRCAGRKRGARLRRRAPIPTGRKCVLGVSPETLRQYGAVSARQPPKWLKRARAAGADFGIGITGIAGPGGGTKESPWGLYFWPRHAKIRCTS